MKFEKFKQNQQLNKSQILNLVSKVLDSHDKDKAMMFAGKNRFNELAKKMINLLIGEYKVHLYNQGNIWKTND